MSPAPVRTATAQCSGPWTSKPLRKAIPPRRTLGRPAPFELMLGTSCMEAM